MKAKKSKSVESGLTASKFMALSDAEKNRIYEEIDSKSTDELLRESKPLNARQKSRWRKMKQVLDAQNNGSAPNSDYSPQSFTEVHRVFVGRSLHQKRRQLEMDTV